MREVNLSSNQGKAKYERLVINLTNTDTGKARKLEYDVRKLSGRVVMEAQMNLAEFAKDKKRDEIVGSLMMKGILASTVAVGGAPELIAVFDELDDDQFVGLVEAIVEAAKASTVTS